MRGSPSDGYASAEKQVYRNSICDFADVTWRDDKKASILCMDTINMYEVKTWIKRGYKPENITVVNNSSANLNGGREFPECRMIKNDVFGALSCLASTGSIPRIVNLDLCGPCTPLLLSNISQHSARARSKDILAVTVWRRSIEPKGTLTECSESDLIFIGNRDSVGVSIKASSKDAMRLCSIVKSISYDLVTRIKWGIYKHMMWVAVEYK